MAKATFLKTVKGKETFSFIFEKIGQWNSVYTI